MNIQKNSTDKRVIPLLYGHDMMPNQQCVSNRAFGSDTLESVVLLRNHAEVEFQESLDQKKTCSSTWNNESPEHLEGQSLEVNVPKTSQTGLVDDTVSRSGTATRAPSLHIKLIQI